MKYKIAKTKTFKKEIVEPRYRAIYGKIVDYVYPMLRNNPFFGPNIKRLKGNHNGLHCRYRA